MIQRICNLLKDELMDTVWLNRNQMSKVILNMEI